MMDAIPAFTMRTTARIGRKPMPAISPLRLALLAAFLGRVDDWVGEAGAVATAMAYTWGLAARTAGEGRCHDLLLVGSPNTRRK